MIAVVIPCYRVRMHILAVLARIGRECERIYVVDDGCPEGTGRYVQERCDDPRVKVLFRAVNGGVGAAVMTGYREALADGAAIIMKIDGDGQTDPTMIPLFAAPIRRGEADYTKGNRFFRIEDVRTMPWPRLVGNAALSFMTKVSSGYWNIFDPANGQTAIHAKVLGQLPMDKISARYFFESDLLFRLNMLRARVVDVPVVAVYRGEISSMRIGRIIPEFVRKHCRNTVQRIFFNYFLRDFSIASVELILGIGLLGFGGVFGAIAWTRGAMTGTFASAGTVMIAALAIILGIQFLLSFLAHDIASVPGRAIHPLLHPHRDGNGT
jgi:glycosyltransferase involved in cell wall biosynthesis